MAEKRMFSKTIIDSDAFLTLSLSAQALYFHLSMRGDDEGFVNKPKSIMRTIGANEDDMKLLITKKFIIPFESGIVVIKHWKIHNYIRGDRIKETTHQQEKSMLIEKENGSYRLNILPEEPVLIGSTDMRKEAYEKSSLPYSFEYKIRNYFYGKKCPVCGCTMDDAGEFSTRHRIPTIQHNIPISKGGEHELYNISVICRACNVSIRDNETEELNNIDVINAWDEIRQASVRQVSGQYRLDKSSIDKDSIENIPAEPKPTRLKLGEFNNVYLTAEEHKKLLIAIGSKTEDYIQKLSAYMKSKGKTYKSHYATVLNWYRRDKETEEKKLSKGKDYDQRNYSKEHFEKDYMESIQMLEEYKEGLEE